MPQQAAMTIWVLATIFLQVNTPNQPTRKRDHVWKKPAVGAVKINVDASFMRIGSRDLVVSLPMTTMVSS